ncbi:MAG: Gfo/Idh/MocA family oxidoreductase [Candidatus Omnitrophica bacterium]|nr:Gfo/Idh/MocA family oxidoreductase [Candidatus Omnitrophota bacterium]
MSVELKKEKRPIWFLDYRKSGGLACDLAIHSLDILEWITGKHFYEVLSYQEKVGNFTEKYLVNILNMILKFKEGGSAVIEADRILPEGLGSDYRLHIVGTEGQIDMTLTGSVYLETKNIVKEIQEIPENFSVVGNWLNSFERNETPCITNDDSIRASLLAIKARESAYKKIKIRI